VRQGVCQLVPGDQVLAEHRVGFTKQDEDCLDTRCNGLFELPDIGSVEIDVIVDVDAMRCWCRFAVYVEDALVEGIAKGPFEPWPFLPAKGAAPLDLDENGVMLCYQRGVEEEAFGKGGLCAMDTFPVGRAEVGAELEACLEE
jgi:hypothetical protein